MGRIVGLATLGYSKQKLGKGKTWHSGQPGRVVARQEGQLAAEPNRIDDSVSMAINSLNKLFNQTQLVPREMGQAAREAPGYRGLNTCRKEQSQGQEV